MAFRQANRMRSLQSDIRLLCGWFRRSRSRRRLRRCVMQWQDVRATSHQFELDTRSAFLNPPASRANCPLTVMCKSLSRAGQLHRGRSDAPLSRANRLAPGLIERDGENRVLRCRRDATSRSLEDSHANRMLELANTALKVDCRTSRTSAARRKLPSSAATTALRS